MAQYNQAASQYLIFHQAVTWTDVVQDQGISDAIAIWFH